MNNPTPTPNSPRTSEPTSPLRCIGGAIVAAGIAYALYSLTTAIMQAFATHPITGNLTAQRIAAAVRTLVVGLSALGTGIFSFAAIGLLGLGVQLLMRRSDQQSQIPPADSES
jgi:hypothetical protein